MELDFKVDMSVMEKEKEKLNDGDIISAWVIGRNDEAKFVTGKIGVEGEGEWCAGEKRFYPTGGGEYNVWYRSEEEALRGNVDEIHDEIVLEEEIVKSAKEYVDTIREKEKLAKKTLETYLQAKK